MEVLMVDDEPDLDLLIKQRFRKQTQDGLLHFHFARNGLEALKLAGELPQLKIVVSDLNMPGMGGLELLMQLKKRHPHLHVIMLSAYGDDQSRITARHAGAHSFLTKPIDFEAFSTLLTHLQHAD
ncbi:MAG: response regulator transcription factor [Holosporales bacterium]